MSRRNHRETVTSDPIAEKFHGKAAIPPAGERDSDRRIDNDGGNRRKWIAGAVVTAIVAGGGVLGFNKMSGGSNNPDEARPDVTAGAPAKTGSTPEAPVQNLTPEQAIGIEQTSYSNVNTPEAANKPEILEQARKPIAADTPLEEAVALMGEKQNIYILTGDAEVFTSMYGSDRTDGTVESEYSEEIEQVKRLHGHSENRFGYFQYYEPNQIIDKETGEQVEITQHESFVPISRTGELSMSFENRYNTNFENVDRDEVFENDKLDNSFVDEGEIIFRVNGGSLFIDNIV